jgi:hypothetical protein
VKNFEKSLGLGMDQKVFQEKHWLKVKNKTNLEVSGIL